MHPVVLIPARLGATRLPDKPLADIGGAPMIVHVWRRAAEANLGPVVVACADEAIAEAVHAAGGTAVLTDPALPSGSDRIHAALAAIDPDRRHDVVINLQGDMPTFPPGDLGRAAALLDDERVAIGTLVGELAPGERDNPNVVKAIVEWAGDGARGRAIAFTRDLSGCPDEEAWHHVGVYAYRRGALERFVRLPPAPAERRARLEQLRALEAGLRIDAARVDTIPVGVDTPADLARLRAMLVAGSVPPPETVPRA